MSKALSLDLRQRSLAAVLEERLSHREATARFKVSAASVGRWRALAAEPFYHLGHSSATTTEGYLRWTRAVMGLNHSARQTNLGYRL